MAALANNLQQFEEANPEVIGMKSLFSRSIKLGLIGSALIGSSIVGTLKALALPQAQVLEKLNPVPVFTITDAQGAPLVASPNGQGKRPVAGVFISQKDAQGFVDKLKKDNPNLGNAVKVVPVSLGDVYSLSQQNQSKPDGLDFAYVPVSKQVEEAKRVLNVNEFSGVPLFVARGGKDNGYLTVKQKDGKEVIPFFFEKEQLQTILNNFKNQQPSLASTVNIQVVNLEGVMKTLTEKNDQGLNSVVLVPSQEAMEFLKSLPQGNSNNQQR